MLRWVWYHSALSFKLEEERPGIGRGFELKAFVFLHQMPNPRDIIIGQKKTTGNFLPLPSNYMDN